MCVAAGEADAPGAHREKEENIQSYRRRVSNQNNRVLDTNEGVSFDVRICVSVRVDVSGKQQQTLFNRNNYHQSSALVCVYC